MWVCIREFVYVLHADILFKFVSFFCTLHSTIYWPYYSLLSPNSFISRNVTFNDHPKNMAAVILTVFVRLLIIEADSIFTHCDDVERIDIRDHVSMTKLKVAGSYCDSLALVPCAGMMDDEFPIYLTCFAFSNLALQRRRHFSWQKDSFLVFQVNPLSLFLFEQLQFIKFAMQKNWVLCRHLLRRWPAN